MRQHGPTPVSMWKIVNALANGHNPQARDRRRCWRLRYWGACRELLRVKLLHRHGPFISISNFAIRPRPKVPERVSPSVARLTSETGGSNPVVPVVTTTACDPQIPKPKVIVASLSTPTGTNHEKSAMLTVDEIKMAATALALRPRRRKIWSGWLKGERMWRLRPVVVPGGQVLPAYFVRRGFVYVVLPDTPEYQDRIFERYRAEDVEVYRSPHAALLGSLPARAGRKRGRPRKVQALTDPQKHHPPTPPAHPNRPGQTPSCA